MLTRTILIAVICSLLTPTARAITLHFEMTPWLAGKHGVTMSPVDPKTTRFTIRISTKNDPQHIDPQAPFVRAGTLEVWSEKSKIARCSVKPKKRGHDLLYSFELNNEFAKNSKFVLVEQLEDGQVGGGKVYSYRLIDFIDPNHRVKEFKQHIVLPDPAEIERLSRIED